MNEATPKDDGCPAFPVVSGHDIYSTGLTKREYIATKALEGLLASGPHDCSVSGLAHDAVLYADALMARLKDTA